MLTLNELSADKGRYRYFLNDEIADVDETFHCEPQADGQLAVNSVRKVPGLTISVLARIDSVGVHAFDVCWSTDRSPAIAASCALEAEALTYSRQIGDTACQPSSIVTTDYAKPLLYPLMRIFTGTVIRQLAELGGEAQVLVPFIADPKNTQKLLSPEITTRRAVAEGDCEVERMNGETIDCTLWRFTGGQYSSDARFWLSADGRLQRYCWQQDESRRWDVRLV